MTKAEQFCKLNGIHWHKWKITGTHDEGVYYYCKCGQASEFEPETPFSDAKSILEVMMKRNDYSNFLCKVGAIIPIDNGIEIIRYIEYLDIFYILNPDKLLDEAILFLEEVKK